MGLDILLNSENNVRFFFFTKFNNFDLNIHFFLMIFAYYIKTLARSNWWEFQRQLSNIQNCYDHMGRKSFAN